MSGLLVAGSIALDTLEGPYGRVEDELGGSATYFTLAASLLGPVTVVAPVGRDGERRFRSALAGRDVDLSGLAVLEAPTYRWSARAALGSNTDLGSRDSIYDVWSPRMPAGFRGWAMVGSMRPDRQVAAARGLARASLLAADAMLSYAARAPERLPELLELAGWFFGTDEEFQAIDPEFEPERFRRRWRLAGVVVKHGPGGCSAYTEAGVEHVAAVTTCPVIDPTGAGDALAGGLLSFWQRAGAGPDRLREALRWGTACASLAIGDVGVRGLVRATVETVRERLRKVPA